MKPKVLIIDNSPGWTGAFKSIWSFSQRLRDRYDFVFCIPSGSDNRKFLSERSVSFVEVPFLEISKSLAALFYIPMLILNAIRIARIARQNEISIIHVNDLYNMAGIVSRAFNPRVKLLHHIRLLPGSYVSSFYRLWIRILSSKADALVTVSRVSLRHIHSVNKREVELVFDTTGQTSTQWVQRDRRPLTFLYPANYTRGKGQDLAIRAFAHALRQQPDQQLVLRLSGDDFGRKVNTLYKAELKKLVNDLELDGKVEVLGTLPDIEKEMLASDAVLNFSESESFSLVCLEALSQGCPLIASDCGGPAELFENEVSGILVPNRDVEAMAKAILRFAGDPSLRERMGSAGKDFVTGKFNPDFETKKLAALYDRLLATGY